MVTGPWCQRPRAIAGRRYGIDGGVGAVRNGITALFTQPLSLPQVGSA
jgi:hypothetical protein